MSDTKLKPCPFCGGEAEAKKEIGGSCWKVKCKQCSCEVGRYWFHNKNHAIIAWNTRKPMDNIVAELEEEKDYSYADMDEYASRYELNLDDCDDWFYKGLARAIDIVKAGGME